MRQSAVQSMIEIFHRTWLNFIIGVATGFFIWYPLLGIEIDLLGVTSVGSIFIFQGMIVSYAVRRWKVNRGE